VNLSELKEGQAGTVVRVGGEGPFRRRLLEMGFIRGTEVYVEKYAPLRDPIELIVKGYHVSLRVNEAARVQVQDVRSGAR
jgi:Fe2+ transport system protein FeoA